MGRRPDPKGGLVAIGGQHPNQAGTAHLGGIVVARRHRNRGLGRLVTGELTRGVLTGDVPGRAAGPPEPVCTLSMYADNAAARASYRSLGYLSVPSWASHLLVRR